MSSFDKVDQELGAQGKGHGYGLGRAEHGAADPNTGANVEHVAQRKFGHTRHHGVETLTPEDFAGHWVVMCSFNDWRSHVRIDHFRDTEKMVVDSGGQLMVIECAFGNRPFVVTKPNKFNNIQVRTNASIWHKESLYNLAVSRLPDAWRTVTFLDGDVKLIRSDWIVEIINRLKHWPCLQPFSIVINLDHEYEIVNQIYSVAWAHHHGVLDEDQTPDYYTKYHPGFGLSMTRECFNNLGGLLDVGICGSSDRNMLFAMLGRVRQSYPDGISDGYKMALQQWEQRAIKFVNGNLGYLPGTLAHLYHGEKRLRKYNERWKILIQNQYDPFTDLKRDSFGLWQFTGNKPQLEKDLARYLQYRQDDSCPPKY